MGPHLTGLLNSPHMTRKLTPSCLQTTTQMERINVYQFLLLSRYYVRILTRQKALYRCGKGPQNPQDFKKCDITLLTYLLKKIDLEMLPHLKNGEIKTLIIICNMISTKKIKQK